MSDLKFRVGIFLGYAPEQGIIDHGIGRLLGFLITGVRSRSASAESIAIACPGWYIPQVRELLADLRIPEDAVTIVTTDGVPYILRLRALLRRLRGPGARPPSAARWGDMFAGIGYKLAESWLGTNNTFLFLARGLLLGLAALILLPVALVALLLRGIGALVGHAFVRMGTVVPALGRIMAYASGPLRELRRDKFAIRVYESIRKQELLRLVRKINSKRHRRCLVLPRNLLARICRNCRTQGRCRSRYRLHRFSPGLSGQVFRGGLPESAGDPEGGHAPGLLQRLRARCPPDRASWCGLPPRIGSPAWAGRHAALRQRGDAAGKP